jgi:hypothetical protein
MLMDGASGCPVTTPLRKLDRELTRYLVTMYDVSDWCPMAMRILYEPSFARVCRSTASLIVVIFLYLLNFIKRVENTRYQFQKWVFNAGSGIVGKARNTVLPALRKRKR